MNKNQEALNRVNKAITKALACQGIDLKEDNETVLALKTLQELVNEHEKLKEENQKLKDKETPKKLKSKTDKDGRMLLVCPTCGDVYKKFWSEVETVSCRKYCDECGQKLDWSEEAHNE
jgi:hypothetical protein